MYSIATFLCTAVTHMAYLTSQQNFVDHYLQTYQEALYFFFLQQKVQKLKMYDRNW